MNYVLSASVRIANLVRSVRGYPHLDRQANQAHVV